MKLYRSKEEWLADTENDVLVQIDLEDGNVDQWFVGFDGKGIAESAELACANLALALGRVVPEMPVIVHWRNGAIYGPFRVALTLKADAFGLRAAGSDT